MQYLLLLLKKLKDHIFNIEDALKIYLYVNNFMKM